MHFSYKDGDTKWTAFRWRLAIRFFVLGLKIAPASDAKEELINHHLEWNAECKRQYKLRYPEDKTV